MLDHQEIQKMLEDAKLTSITQIVSFIATHVQKVALKPIENIQQRLAQLQKPKGMDRIMIQEVKAFVEAMIDQREQALRREVDKKYRDNIFSSYDLQQNSRRSLNQLDFINIMNMQQGTQSQQLRKGNSVYYPLKSDPLIAEVKELREQLLGKPQRREFQQIKASINSIGKDLISKITFQETEKLILKFQKDIFIKLAENKGLAEQLESKMKRQIQQQVYLLKKQISEVQKTKGHVKFEKKIKRHNQQLQKFEQKLVKMNKESLENSSICRESHKNCLQDIENLQNFIEQLADQKQCQLLKQSKSEKKELASGFWIAAPPKYKNSCVVWERQISNSDPAYLEFQSGKTSIRLVNAGFYEIVCTVYGGSGSMKKGPIILCNSEQIGRLEAKPNNNQNLPKWYFRQWVYLKQNRTTLAVRFEGEQNSTCILFGLNKLSF